MLLGTSSSSGASVKSLLRTFTAPLDGTKMLDGNEAPPDEFISACLRSGNVIPDETDPWDPSKFHANWQGYEAGHTDQEARKQWFESMNAQLAAFESWDKVDIHTCDPDYAMTYGDNALGSKLPFADLKPMIDEEREKMTNIYKRVLDEQKRKEPAAWAALASDTKFATADKNKDGSLLELVQPTTNMQVLYQGNIAALPDLWRTTCQIAAAGGSKRCCWSLKRLMRTNKKLQEKYNKRVSRVTDISRTSIVLETLEGLVAAFDCVLSIAKVLRTKNRFVDPELGYSDILLNLMMPNDFIVEVQLQLACIYNLKSESGHSSFKWFRRLLMDEENYIGDINKEGQRHGHGKLMAPNGDEYEGQWRNNMKDGQGIFLEADGHKYDGQFKENNRHGECTFTYFDGSKYMGSYVKDKKHGQGTFTQADGKSVLYEGQWFKGKRHGEGTFNYVDGSKYSGSWKMHKRHGQGSYTSPEGEVHKATWNEDNEVAQFLSLPMQFLHMCSCSGQPSRCEFKTGSKMEMCVMQNSESITIEKEVFICSLPNCKIQGPHTHM